MPEPTSGTGKPANKNKNFKNFMKKHAKLIIGLAAGIVLGAGITLLIIFANKHIANYSTIDGIKSTVQKGIPTYCEFELVSGENGYQGDTMSNTIAVDNKNHLLLDSSKRQLDNDSEYFGLFSDGYLYTRIIDGDYDEATKAEQDGAGYINVYTKTFLDDSSLSFALTTAKSFSCRRATKDDFKLPDDVDFVEESENTEPEDGSIQ